MSPLALSEGGLNAATLTDSVLEMNGTFSSNSTLAAKLATDSTILVYWVLVSFSFWDLILLLFLGVNFTSVFGS